MSTINIKLDFLICETSINTFLCKFYYYDNVNSAIKPWTAQQSTKQDALALMQTYSNDLYTALLNIEGITPLGGGSVTDYGTYSEMSFDLVVETGSQSQEIDYTQILTSINSNLASIASKNNQSDIVNCLNNIFCYVKSDNSIVSSIKYTDLVTDTQKETFNLINLFFNLLRMFINSPISSNDLKNGLLFSVSNLNDISKKLSLTIPDNEDNVWNCGISRRLAYLCQIISGKSITNASSMRSDSLLKEISDKLANTNDLHTISQAIDLISTAIAQTPTADISPLTSAVQNLKLEQNNLIQVEGDIDYRIKYDKDKE